MGIRCLLRHRGGAKDKERDKDDANFHMSHTFMQPGLPDFLRQLDCSMNHYDAKASTLQGSAKKKHLAIRMDFPLSSSYCAPPANTL